jgi:hypothetical protein
MNAPVGPFFVAPHLDDSEGVDYLGLRATNLSMMNSLIPGINNVVSLVRPFSVIAWSCWRYANAVRESGMKATPQAFDQFRQKVETLFVWGHVQLNDAAGLPGNQQHDSGAKMLTFQFKPFRRTASLLDAALYGPAMKTLNGLGFVYSVEGFFKVTSAGEALAAALDKNLREQLTAAQYHFLAHISDMRCDRDDLAGLAQAWHTDAPTSAEQASFAGQLYVPSEIGNTSNLGVRSTVLHLVLETLRDNGKLTTDEVRRHLACSPLPEALLGHPAAEVFRYAKRAWQLLQLRQAQRLGLECLFGWVERCLIHDDGTSIADLVDLTLAALQRDTKGAAVDDNFVRNGYAFYRNGDASVDELFEGGEADPECLELFTNMGRLEEASSERSTDTPMALHSVALLLQCAAFAEAFRLEPYTASRLEQGPAFRIPLGLWGTVVKNHLELPLRDFLRKVIETFVVSQHLGVAASRSSDERSRMRLSIEDRGLTSLLPHAEKVLVPARTPDRLATAMALMAGCGLISADASLRHGGSSVKYFV